LINEIDFENTLFIITSDHGVIVPFDNRSLTDFEPKFKQIVNTGRKLVPSPLQPVGVNFLKNLRGKIRDKKLKGANKGLTPFQIRSRLPFFTLSLFDEALHIKKKFMEGICCHIHKKVMMKNQLFIYTQFHTKKLPLMIRLVYELKIINIFEIQEILWLM